MADQAVFGSPADVWGTNFRARVTPAIEGDRSTSCVVVGMDDRDPVPREQGNQRQAGNERFQPTGAHGKSKTKSCIENPADSHRAFSRAGEQAAQPLLRSSNMRSSSEEGEMSAQRHALAAGRAVPAFTSRGAAGSPKTNS